MGGMEQNGAANSVIWLREKCVVCLSLELQQIECALTNDANDLYVTADRGHILIVHGLLSSYRTSLFTPAQRPAPHGETHSNSIQPNEIRLVWKRSQNTVPDQDNQVHSFEWAVSGLGPRPLCWYSERKNQALLGLGYSTGTIIAVNDMSANCLNKLAAVKIVDTTVDGLSSEMEKGLRH